jgi:hypothetical protein
MFLILRALPKWSRGGRTRTGHGSVELGEAFVLPRYQSLPKGLRIKLSDADILEREFSLALLSASGKHFLLPVVRLHGKVLQAADGIFQHRGPKFFFDSKLSFFS